MTEQISDVQKWLTVGGFKFGDESKVPLSISLVEEEILELKEGISKGDKKECLDAIGDIFVTLHNVSQSLGYTPELITQYQEAISKSNWSKYCSDQKEAEDTVEAYRSGTHPSKMGTRIDSYYEKVGNYYVIYRHDGKILKSINFREPTYFLEN